MPQLFFTITERTRHLFNKGRFSSDCCGSQFSDDHF